ncbi:MAG: hypothetical protein HYY37_03385 [Candidatus Aenigmarchaeota archaeon]|nr:hypothetical protein [Candidatus Aenigmarchaeota archaeon]
MAVFFASHDAILSFHRARHAGLGTAVNSTSGQLLTAGNAPVRIYGASASGTLMFNDTFNNKANLR